MKRSPRHFDESRFGFYEFIDHGSGLVNDANQSSILQHFSIHIHERGENLVRAIHDLEERIETVDLEVDKIRLESMQFSDNRQERSSIKPGLQSSDELSPMGNKENVDQAIMEKEEETSILDGIAALNLYHDTGRIHHDYDSEEFFGEEGEPEFGGSTSNHYNCATADSFNQRPLPFIVGSKAFMKSRDGGIGSD